MPELKNFEITDEKVNQIAQRVLDLKDANTDEWRHREQIRDLMDGGVDGLSRLVGRDITEDEAMIPAVNMVLMANTRLAQKLGGMPDVKVDPPVDTDSQRARKHAEKRERILHSWDRESKLEMQLPQAARWTPGYGFTPFTMRQKRDPSSEPFPHIQVRDPFNCFPGEWGLDQQPDDLAFIRLTTPERLMREFPDMEGEIKAAMNNNRASQYDHLPRSMGGFVLDTTWDRAKAAQASWQNQFGTGLEIYEYWNDEGTWFIVPELKLLLAYIPNPLDQGPAFHVIKRFAFNKLNSQYHHVVGLMASIARLNTLAVVAAEDVVNAETVIIGDTIDGDYTRGRRAINRLMQGSAIEKMNDRIPFEVFQQIDRLETQLRQGASYPITDDAASPISFVTGAGLDELKGSVNAEVKEYHTAFRNGLQDLDAKRFEWAEKLYPNRELTMHGVTKGGAFADKYTPRVHIKGNRHSRRVYGIMAGWDEPVKIATGLNLLQGEIIDDLTMQENLEGLEDIEKVRKRIRQKKIQDLLIDGIGQRAAQGDPDAIKALVEQLEPGDVKELLQEFYIEPMEEQQNNQAPPQAGQAPPDVQTVMQKLTSSGKGSLGVQNVGRV
ncbi:MAG: hypothetical protein R3185_02020 [Candidatus Thermoplasmatota archaeon]|nr:hypothetical protein [Candidatus Thermoplasmatota archaeon]